jgi:spore germination cell wall hydrolase CwlJ-like protein
LADSVGVIWLQDRAALRLLFALCFLSGTAAADAAVSPGGARAAMTLPIGRSPAEAAGGASIFAAIAAPQAPGSGDDRRASIECLATAIAYEAGNEPEAGKQAVAQVILNRSHHRAFPKTICGVIYQGSDRRTGCQFTFTCDGSLRRALSRRTWASAQAVATAAIDGVLPPTIGLATHYHADYVMPRWAPTMSRIGQIGAHIFYGFPGGGAGAGGSLAGLLAERGLRRPRSTGPAPTVFMAWGLVPVPPATAADSQSPPID